MYNRCHLIERLAALLTAAQTGGDTLAIALFDIDKIKVVNGQHGQLAGDAVPIKFAHVIGEQLPADALLAHWGGEELLVALPCAYAPGGLAFADDLRHLSKQVPTLVARLNIRCTVRSGVATYLASGATMDNLFRAA